jgi:hypothetical protein
MKIDELTNTALRAAIRTNQVSFPAQVPIFHKQARPDLQWRLAELYFIHGWSFLELGKRYNLTPQRIIQIVNGWRSRVTSLGLIKDIPIESTSLLCEPPPSYRHHSPDRFDTSERPRALQEAVGRS